MFSVQSIASRLHRLRTSSEQFPARWCIRLQSSIRSRDSFFSARARKQRMAKQLSKNQQKYSTVQLQGTALTNVRLSVARTNKLKNCKSADQMLTELQGFETNGQRPVDAVQPSIIFTRLPRFQDSIEVKQQVLREVLPDLVKAVESEFPHPATGHVTTQGIGNVAWGFIQLKQKAQYGSDFPYVLCELEGKLLQLLDKHLDKCNAADLSNALHCFVKANYPGLKSKRISNLIFNQFESANGQDTTRFLYLLPKLGVDDGELAISLGQQVVNIADDPQSCSNAALALARQAVDAEEVAQQLVSKMISLDRKVKAQDISNAFLALYERGWKVEKYLAIQLLEELLDRLKHGDEVLPYAIIQFLRGIERHGVTTELDLRPLVTFLLQKCTPRLYDTFSDIASSLQKTGYPFEEQIVQLLQLSGTGSFSMLSAAKGQQGVS